MFDINISKEDERIIELWGNCYTAFNTIKFEGDQFRITGGDYSDDVEIQHYDELIAFIKSEVESAIMTWAIEGDTDTLTEVCTIEN